ncbi:MAG: hypothetical protein U0175_33465 [Caldilineaceae bacterium]
MFLLDEMVAQARHQEYEARLQRTQQEHGYARLPRNPLLPDLIVFYYHKIVCWLSTYAQQRLTESKPSVQLSEPQPCVAKR